MDINRDGVIEAGLGMLRLKEKNVLHELLVLFLLQLKTSCILCPKMHLMEWWRQMSCARAWAQALEESYSLAIWTPNAGLRLDDFNQEFKRQRILDMSWYVFKALPQLEFLQKQWKKVHNAPRDMPRPKTSLSCAWMPIALFYPTWRLYTTIPVIHIDKLAAQGRIHFAPAPIGRNTMKLTAFLCILGFLRSSDRAWMFERVRVSASQVSCYMASWLINCQLRRILWFQWLRALPLPF